MLKYAVAADGAIAIRYPRGTAYAGLEEYRAPIERGKAELIYDEGRVALLCLGSMVKTGEEVRERLKNMGIDCSLINARFAKPIDEDMLKSVMRVHKMIVIMEENVGTGGYGERCRDFLDEAGYTGKVITINIPDEYVEHGNVEILKKVIGIDKDSILAKIRRFM